MPATRLCHEGNGFSTLPIPPRHGVTTVCLTPVKVTGVRARRHLHANFYRRPGGNDGSAVNSDGTTGSAVALDDIPNWCTLIPDYETNRLHIRLNYPGSAIFFSDPLCTLGSVLGFTSDLNTTSETLKMLETESIGLDIL